MNISSLSFILFFCLTLLLPITGHAEHGSETQGESFSYQNVINLAESLSFKPYQPLPSAPEALLKLDYSNYRKINFQQHAAIWGNTPTPFSIQLFAPGYLFKDLVNIDIVENGVSYPVKVTEDSFSVPDPEIATILEQVSKYAGFRLHYPLNSKDYADEFIVFQGASYFRAVSKGQNYGISTRGLAIDVAEPKGEEFPLFKHFWIERPSKKHKAIVVHALLDSESVSGAYRFGIYPDNPTHMDVTVKLFPRRDINHIGIAPLTSMFMHNSMKPPLKPDYRPAVHDSEALAIKRGNGENIWRPLNNPDRLQISAFTDENPLGFGLIQRHREFNDYQDLEANYHNRPSVWVKPTSSWGKGHVQLVEIPSDSEANDNIVAYWRPEHSLKQGHSYTYSYQLSWPDDISPMTNGARITRSALGTKLFKEDQEIVIDISPVEAEVLKTAQIEAVLSEGQLLETRVQANPENKGARVFLSFDPKGADQIEIRLRLTHDSQPISETWLYRWTKKPWKL